MRAGSARIRDGVDESMNDEIRGQKIYIAGPMRGIPLFNFPAFDNAAEEIRSVGGIPFNPAEMDRSAGFNPESLPASTDWRDVAALGFDMDAAIERDLDAIRASDAIYMLDGWQRSHGASTEHAVAVWAGKKVYYQSTPTEDVLHEAIRITSGDRNAQYGDPNIDFERTAGMWQSYLQHPISTHDVAWMMVMLKASRNRHQAKRDNYVDAAGYIRCGARCEGFSKW